MPMPKLERVFPFRTSPLADGRSSMQEQAEHTEPSLPAGALRNAPCDPALVQALRAVTSMVAYISHDLRQPLTAILANAEFLTQSDISEMQRKDFCQEIRWGIDRMNELISSFLEFSKGADTLRPAARNIVDTIGRAIRMTCVKRQFCRINITHHHEGLAVGWFDSSRLERVVSNLVLNACEAVCPDSGQIVITSTGNRASLQIAVWDNGPGIPPTIRDSAFQPFVTHGKAEGSGLGLAIAKKIVEDHDGRIYFDGSCEHGALVRITIPFAIPEQANPLRSISAIRSTRTSRSAACSTMPDGAPVSSPASEIFVAYSRFQAGAPWNRTYGSMICGTGEERE